MCKIRSKDGRLQQFLHITIILYIYLAKNKEVMSTKVFLFICLTFGSTALLADSAAEYAIHEVKAKKGDGILSLLRRYDLQDQTCNLESFYRLNSLKQSDGLIAGKKYLIPVKIFQYNGKSIRSTIGITDYDKALEIAKYNLRLKEKGIRKTSYLDSKILWVPFHYLDCDLEETKASPEAPVKEVIRREFIDVPLLGEERSRLEIVDRSLNGKVYYIISGHGGPDPGARAEKGNTHLCEDEYAYDVSLRLYEKLLSHGATAYMIIQDANDGIRSDHILEGDQDEKCLGKAPIPISQRIRLDQRTQAVNHLYKKNLKKGLTDQTAICIHVDSRSETKRQDVFFYYYGKSKASKALADNMLKTFSDKYKVNRRSGEYSGTVSSRNLYVIKNTLPKAVFVELANIRNKKDQERILYPSNRQALAEWLYLGLVK